jgi:hypothetical protein
VSPGFPALDPEEVAVEATRTMTIDFEADDEAILISLQLDRALAERVFADATVRQVRPSDVAAAALREHYARSDLHP